MNQVMQRRVYQLGTDEQAEFLADISGMKGEVRRAFLLLHDGYKEQFIRNELGIEHDAYALIEEMVSTKLLLAVFDCINHRMNEAK